MLLYKINIDVCWSLMYSHHANLSKFNIM